MLGNYAAMIRHDFLSSIIHFKLNFLESLFQEYQQSVKQIIADQGRRLVGPDLGPNCLQRLSTDDTSRQIINSI